MSRRASYCWLVRLPPARRVAGIDPAPSGADQSRALGAGDASVQRQQPAWSARQVASSSATRLRSLPMQTAARHQLAAGAVPSVAERQVAAALTAGVERIAAVVLADDGP